MGLDLLPEEVVMEGPKIAALVAALLLGATCEPPLDSLGRLVRRLRDGLSLGTD